MLINNKPQRAGAQVGLIYLSEQVQLLSAVLKIIWGCSSTGEHLVCNQNVAGSNPAISTIFNGLWCNLVALVIWDHAVAGSNPASPTKNYIGA